MDQSFSLVHLSKQHNTPVALLQQEMPSASTSHNLAQEIKSFIFFFLFIFFGVSEVFYLKTSETSMTASILKQDPDP